MWCCAVIVRMLLGVLCILRRHRIARAMHRLLSWMPHYMCETSYTLLCCICVDVVARGDRLYVLRRWCIDVLCVEHCTTWQLGAASDHRWLDKKLQLVTIYVLHNGL